MTKRKREIGARGFSEKYWQENYSDPVSMDCVGNSKEHVRYLKAVFALEYVDVSCVIDFGFGPGQLLKEVARVFLPHQLYGIEPSKYIFDIVKNKIKLKIVESMKIKLEQIDLRSWCEINKDSSKVFDLGLCTSVFQYLSQDELNFILPILAQKVKYLYCCVPTDKELDRQVSELQFLDRFAFRRSRNFYYKIIGKHFTFVAGRILESKVHFDEVNTHFTDLLFRF